MKRKKLFCGVCTALATPLCAEGIDIPALEQLIERQIDGGVDALCLCGTTGEAATLTDEERQTLLEVGIRQIHGRVPCIVGVGTPSTARSIAYAKDAYERGADGLLVVTPYYNKGTEAGLRAHYYAIADSTPLPVTVYHVPSRTGVRLSLETLSALAEHPRITSLKEADDSCARLSSLVPTLGPRMALYSGNDAQIVQTYAVGGDGVVSVLSNLFPHRVKMLCELCQTGRYAEAAILQSSLIPLITLLFRETNPAPLKAAMAHLGLCSEHMHLPLSPIGNDLRRALIAELEKQMPEENKNS